MNPVTASVPTRAKTGILLRQYMLSIATEGQLTSSSDENSSPEEGKGEGASSNDDEGSKGEAEEGEEGNERGREEDGQQDLQRGVSNGFKWGRVVRTVVMGRA
jgi:hypothetical protein